ncbi:TetR/AcrR family transcriptional regulator [Actinomadura violacea]|uniref:Helix-turn-helix transcriptional regulator n=1 Tax=Actinomadura violacea TaxID=2819934 RepID=A0ABS3RLA4_9ACTN|nr:helix-turn-helix domain-containing protein [Actinomadura violacea]MBO2457520.1 helix-turn-helix transcriptional regulator [Actinomadura violacea]
MGISDAERNRRAILDTAAGMFAEQGMRLTLEQIAKAAGIGVGTIYRRFPTLDALIDELVGERIRWWADHVTEGRPGAPAASPSDDQCRWSVGRARCSV